MIDDSKNKVYSYKKREIRPSLRELKFMSYVSLSHDDDVGTRFTIII